ncbi:hypothetical protein E3O19_09185 [Cryobacterium algoritolerans]|uniref:Uncharacterized protein n=1 Tax=Cryobacterium algoritolerans TaxID=1259184 RepID=A0A4R8WS42_9MICO|nr:hypothetical protein [Cryobacterium algoritolerans]TFC15285.1 hypothetical protein E3O19_09185 [Cryobacterium algoritolerans]
MTLGNDPQPLTRRQARELAQGHEPASADQQNSSNHIPTHSSGSTPAQTAAPDKPAVASAFAPPATKSGWAAAVSAPRQPVPKRTLTRRELRAVQLAQGHDDESGQSEPIAVELQGTPAPVVKAKQPVPVEFLVESKSSSSSARVRPGVLHPPVGHWSLDRDDDDGSIPSASPIEPFDQLMSRGISAGGIPTTTNALILPLIPHQGTTSGPLTSTGEIMITGSIDLPRSLGSTGAHPNLFDSAEMDHMLDQLDESGHHSDVAPVSASRAVSTHASTRGVMAPPAKRGVTLPTVLTITVGVLALGVVALFIAGYVLKIF